jgi:small-conductance mechanosensitive channel
MVPTIALAAIALALSLVAGRPGVSVAIRSWQRFLLLTCVAAWVVVGFRVGLVLLAGQSVLEVAARAVLLAALVVAAMPLLRDLLTGVALALEHRHRIGDEVRLGEHEGRIVAFGIRGVLLRRSNGTETSIPNRTFAAGPVVRLDLETGGHDAPVTLELELPAGLDLDVARRRLLDAALLSPFAAPGKRPEVFAVADERGNLRLRLRAHVFDRAHEERYRGDVVLRAALNAPPDPIAVDLTTPAS